MKIGILIGIILFSFELRAEVREWKTLTARQESVGSSLYNQVRRQVRRLKKVLKSEQLFNKAEFARLERLIKSNDLTLVMAILEKYELKGDRAVEKAVKRLRKRLNALSKNETKTQSGDTQNDGCPGSGLEQTEFFSTERAFAALKPTGVVVTWGDSAFGGDSSAVTDELSCGVVKIFSTKKAFAALKSDGSVVTWGDAKEGGDSSSVSGQLAGDVKEIVASQKAFAAIKKNGSLVVWGDRHSGGETSIMRESYRRLRGWEAFPLHQSLLDGSQGKVVKVVASDFAFAAILEDSATPPNKSVFAWGDELFGGDLAVHSVAGILDGGEDSRDGQYISSFRMKDISPLLEGNVVNIFSTRSAFAALKSDGSVVTWGTQDEGGGSDSVSDQIQSGVTKIFSNDTAFAALKSDGSVVAWGHRRTGGNLSTVSSELQSNVRNIVSNNEGFTAIKNNGSVVIWGQELYRRSFEIKSPSLTGIASAVPSARSFAVLKSNGSVDSWGDIFFHDYSLRDALEGGIVKIFSNEDAFAALTDSGGVVTWGWADSGGYLEQLVVDYWDARDADYRANNELTEEELRSQNIHHLYRIKSGVVKIASTKAAFVALKSDGTIVTWGATGYGADSSRVASLFGTGSH